MYNVISIVRTLELEVADCYTGEQSPLYIDLTFSLAIPDALRVSDLSEIYELVVSNHAFSIENWIGTYVRPDFDPNPSYVLSGKIRTTAARLQSFPIIPESYVYGRLVVTMEGSDSRVSHRTNDFGCMDILRKKINKLLVKLNSRYYGKKSRNSKHSHNCCCGAESQEKRGDGQLFEPEP